MRWAGDRWVDSMAVPETASSLSKIDGYRRRRNAVTAGVTVNCAQRDAFSMFMRRMSDWWPFQNYSLGHDTVHGAHIEERVGGRLFERRENGEERTWGTVLEWDPPSRAVISWEVIPGPVTTYVELKFRSLGPGVTRVSIEHTGWENLAPGSVPSNCDYSAGWDEVLRAFQVLASAPEAAS